MEMTGLAKPRILIVDDEEIVRLNIERILEAAGYETCSAGSGKEALRLISQNEFDLVLTDLIMEDMDGLALLEEIKRTHVDVVVIIVTGYGSLSSAIQAMQKGAFDYIIKPCSREELVLRVKKGIEKRELEVKLLEVKRMEAILSNIGVFTLDDKGVILSAHPGMSSKLWGDIQVVGQRLQDLPGLAECGVADCFYEALEGKEVARENIRFYAGKERREYILSCHLLPVIKRNGRVKTLMWIIEDLTKRTRIMQQISQAEKLAALGKLAAGVAHEINNPLNIISLDVEYLRSHLDPDSPLMENLQSIREEVDRIAHIVQQLQDHAKTEDSIQERININDVLRSHIFSITFSQLGKKRINVELQLEEGLPQVLIPKTKITQVLMNMIKNAEDAMPQGGKLTVVTRKVVPRRDGETDDEAFGGHTWQNARDLVEIQIIDTGCGIKEENLAYLFEPFFTTKGFNGTGLGLFISYSIIKSYNGRIKVDSQLGKGSTFSVILPSTAPA